MSTTPHPGPTKCTRARVLHAVAVMRDDPTIRQVSSTLERPYANVAKKLKALADDGLLERHGEGVRGDPYRYRLAEGEA